MRTTILGLVFVLICGVAFAQRTVMIDDMTGTEVMEAIAQGAKIEVQSQEQAAAQRSAQARAQQQPATGGKRPKRNEPCPCGSGVKYKKCCHPAFD